MRPLDEQARIAQAPARLGLLAARHAGGFGTLVLRQRERGACIGARLLHERDRVTEPQGSDDAACDVDESAVEDDRCLVMMLTIATNEFGPYDAEFGPRVTSMRSMSAMATGSCCQKTREYPGRYMDTPSIRTFTLAAAYPSVDDTIAHLAEVIQAIETGRMPEPQYPKYWRVAINESVARSLNVVVSDAARSLGHRPREGTR